MTNVLRTAYVNVAPKTDGFDVDLKEQLRRKDPGGQAGKLVGSQLNAALRRVDIATIDIKADPKQALLAIKATEERLKALSRDSATVEVRVRTEKALSELRRFKKSLGDVGGEAGSSAATKFVENFKLGPIPAGVAAPLTAALAGAAVLVVPWIGATISAAVIGGAGVGGVIGGLVLAAKDPRVQAAGKLLGANLLGALQKDASVFIGPALSAIDLIGSRFDEVDGQIQNTLRNAASFVRPLTDGITRAIQSIVGGVDALVAKAGPVMSVISSGVAQVGDAIGDVFRELSGNGAAAAAALQIAFNLVSTTIRSIGATVDVLTKAFGLLAKLGAFGKQAQLQMIAFEVSSNLAAAQVGVFTNRMSVAAVTADDLAKAQAGVTAAQAGLQTSLTQITAGTSAAAQRSNALRQAMDGLFGATINQANANQAYEASWDSLTASVSANGRSLNIHTVAGRANRDALQGLITSTNDLYLADIAAGSSVAAATLKHNLRIIALKEEARKAGLNAAATRDLIGTYGQIPKKKNTDLLVSGVNAIVQALKDLYVFQRALADGIPIASEIAKLKGEKGPAKKYGGYATGGQIGGWSPNSRADNIPAMLTAKEWVHPVDAVNYYGPQIMGAIQKRQVPREVLTAFASGALGKLGDLPFFAKGGPVAPIDTSPLMRFMTDASNTRVPSRAEVESKVPIGAGPGGAFARSQDGKPYIWASAGPAGYDCSGIVSAVYNVLHGRSPYSHTFSTSSLPGQWFTKPGIGKPLTAAWSNPGESPASSTTGHMMGMVNGLTFESSGSRGVHLGASTRRLTDFAHIAHYAQGGQVPFASYDSGGYLPPGISLAHNGTGRPEPVGRGDTWIFNFNGPIASKQGAKAMVWDAIKELKNERKIP